MQTQKRFVFAVFTLFAFMTVLPSVLDAFVPGGAGSSRQSLGRSFYRAQEGACSSEARSMQR